MTTTKTIMIVFGTRPEAIKMAPVIRALRMRPRAFRVVVCVTAQHREMLDQALRTFGIVPDIDLDLMRDRQDLADLSAAVLSAMRPVIAQYQPDLLLVHGDTTTSLASALAAFYAGVPVGHVEAGLRSGSLAAPFPEEINRRAVDMIAHHHFAPTERNRANLLAEGCNPNGIAVVGNSVVDALLQTMARIDQDTAAREAVELELDRALGFAWRSDRYVVVTSHRRENLLDGFTRICMAVRDAAASYPAVRFVFSLHANPVVREMACAQLTDCGNVRLIEPLSYDAFIHLLRHCRFVLTDSGGLQEEAPVLGSPVLLMRERTERPEAVEAGGVRLVGTDVRAIVAGMTQLLDDDDAHAAMASANNPYGDGTTGERIAAHLERVLFSADASG